MKITDLSHIINSEMPVFPGTEPPILLKANTLEKHGFRETKITMYSHTGTHIDAPAHMLPEGLYLDNIEIEHFIGNARVLDFSDIKQQSIGVEELRPFEEKIKKVEFIIIKTGWSKHWGNKKYFETFPYLSEGLVSN